MENHEFSLEHRRLIIFLIDFSASMFDVYVDANGKHQRKGDYVANEVNKLLRDLYMRAHNGRQIYDIYDIAVITYSGDRTDVISSYDRSLNYTPIKKLFKDNNNYFTVVTPQVGYEEFAPRGGDGAVLCRIEGFTPMYKALNCAYELTCRWCAEEKNRMSEGPLIVNISDGMATDADYVKLGSISERIQQVRTAVNNSMVFNIFVSSAEGGNAINFPTDEELKTAEDQYVGQIGAISSFMPYHCVEQVETLRQSASVKRKYRAMVYNLDPANIFDMLFVGTSTAYRG